ncbi:MAG: hypothetical protein ACKPGW_33180 [Microcystis panniformis]
MKSWNLALIVGTAVTTAMGFEITLQNPAYAISISNEQKNLLVRDLSYAVDLANIAFQYGNPDQGQPVIIDSTGVVNSNNWTNNVSTTYQGLPLELNYNGSFDQQSNAGNYNLLGSISGIPITGSGSASFTDDPVNFTTTVNWLQQLTIFDPSVSTVGATFTWTFGGSSSVGLGGNITSENGFSGNVDYKIFSTVKDESQALKLTAAFDKKIPDGQVIKLKAEVDVNTKKTDPVTTQVSVEIKKQPEPSSTLSLSALGALGAASTIKRKLKSSKSTGKETTKVG